MLKMTRAIFVVGRDRSGTKWLSNIIANHKDVACVQHEEHYGILEATDILTNSKVLFGNLNIPENFIAFLECFSQTDFFSLTKLNKRIFYNFGPQNYLHIFKKMMDIYAENEKKKYWVQKIGIFEFKDLYDFFLEGKFIIIKRNIFDNLQSKIGQRMLYSNSKNIKKYIFKNLVEHFIDNVQMNKYCKQRNVHIVKYEKLKSEKKAEIKKLSNFIQLEFDENMLVDNYPKNTSFRNGVFKKQIFTKSDILKINIYIFFLNFIPSRIYEMLYPRRFKNYKKLIQNPVQKKLFSLKLRLKDLKWEQY
jgi:hypothetical protein